MADELPNLIYSHRDPADVLSDLKSELKTVTQGAWSDFLDASIPYAVVKSAVALYDFNAFNVDQNTAETFLSLAMLRESVIRRAKELGYVPQRSAGSSVSIKLTITNMVSNSTIVIPAFSTWSINGISFTNLQEIDITAPNVGNSVTQTAYLTQGTPYSSTFNGTGIPWSKVILPITATNFTVKVNGTTWAEVDSFLEVSNPNSYKVYEDVGGQTICFGNNVSTNMPGTTDSVNITAILTNGFAGNIFTSGIAVNLTSVVRDSNGTQFNNNINAVTTSIASGGLDVESTDSIRANAPAYYSTQGRAVTADDWKAVTMRFPGVAKASVIGGETINQYSKVFITAYADSPYQVDPSFIQELTNYLNQFKILTITPVVQAPVIAEVTLGLELGLSQNSFSIADSISNLVSTAVSSYFDKIDIGSPLYQSALASIIQAISGIVYVDMTSSVRSFADSHAGVITIPVLANAEVTNCILTKASDNTVIFSGDGSQYLINGNFVYTYPITPDQQFNLRYTTTDPNLETINGQVLILESLTIDKVFI